ncbi:NADH-quinone oxidoreductase subunit N [Hyphococcus sp.]|jgi:NADH-quinone oxidoreductase subunit N|uniref:NADH-quinone oxidoreductase subunit N n=1 Tax=Hyphococcus sp. TaxID=2038636 RepID=UPI003D0C9180
MTRDLSFLIPELTLASVIVLMLIAEMARAPRVALGLGVLGLVAAAGLTLPLIDADTTVFSGTYRIDLLSAWGKLILLPGAALTLLLARAELAGSDREGSAYSLICLVTLGALMLTGGGDMMMLVLGVVLTGLGSFALVAYPRDDKATEAAMKFLVFGSVCGAVMIYGLTFWFGAVGSTLFSALSKADAPLAVAIGLIALIVGLGYKSALFPFQFWAPDAYDGAPVSIAAFLSVITKIAAIFAFAQVLRDLAPESGWRLAIAAIAVATMTFGNLAALVQSNIVRLLAYSSVAQSGYFLLGVVSLGESALSLRALIVFAAAYVAMNIGAFAVLMALGRHLDDFLGVGRTAPITGAAMVVFLLSLAGIPPLFGFAGKFLLFAAAIEAKFIWLAVIAILNSVLSLAVYLRIIAPMYERREAQPPGRQSRNIMIRFTWLVALGATLGFGVGAQLLLACI